MAIQIKASARLVEANAMVLAATAADAGKIALWIQKATGAKGKTVGKAGKKEGLEFKIKAGKDTLTMKITLDVAGGGTLHLDGSSKLLGDSWSSNEKTGRQTILDFKNHLRSAITGLDADDAPETVALLKKLISAKSKVEA